ncbi:MAG TPA: ADP-ribosylglycohydrolase family protein [Vicinamibacterales bacterium]|nr:ADP-ribosylglycohydrolase family protein [Vicinamibacterales bacterium]
MLGAIAGDVIGSVYEHAAIKTVDFPLFRPNSRFTDDTVLTVATAWAILRDRPFDEAYREFGQRYPRAGYGSGFRNWLFSDAPAPYMSLGNGSAMRVSPVGWAGTDEAHVLALAERSASVTHNHPEGIKGAQATALAVFAARTGASKGDIRETIASRFGYDLDRTIDQMRPTYAFDITCEGTVPAAIVAFLDSTDVEDAIRLAISLGGDSDTLAAIAGGMAHAHYGTLAPDTIRGVRDRLPSEFIEIIDEFSERYCP